MNPVLTILVIFIFSTCTLVSADETPTDEQLLSEIQSAINNDQDAKVVAGLTEYLKRKPSYSRGWYLQGVYQFRVANFKESVNAFDKYVELDPAVERRLWERGISHFYAGMNKEGAEQFALYQTYHDNDVENSVWRFLCMAKTEGIEKSRKEMLPIRNDRRIPLMEVYALFRGESTPEKVMEVANAGEPSKAELESRLFYAKLYLAIYYEAIGKFDDAEKYARQAWKDHEKTERISRYMWQVARIHTQFCEQRRKTEQDAASKQK